MKHRPQGVTLSTEWIDVKHATVGIESTFVYKTDQFKPCRRGHGIQLANI